MGILRQYVSPILAESTLAQALDAQGIDAASFGPTHVDAVVEHAMVGLRMFCDPARLPDMMVALAEYCAARHVPLGP